MLLFWDSQAQLDLRAIPVPHSVLFHSQLPSPMNCLFVHPPVSSTLISGRYKGFGPGRKSRGPTLTPAQGRMCMQDTLPASRLSKKPPRSPDSRLANGYLF